MKPPKCKICKNPATIKLPLTYVCSYECVEALILKNKAKKQLKVERLARKELAEGRLAQKSRAQWRAEALTAMQQSRRLEELAKGRGCMSCGRSQAEVQGADMWQPGGFWDGGHFQGKGAFPEKALIPENIWLQCKRCNGGSGKYARKSQTVADGYEANLIAQEGLQLVEWLKGKHEPAKHTIDELAAIKRECNAISAKLKAAINDN